MIINFLNWGCLSKIFKRKKIKNLISLSTESPKRKTLSEYYILQVQDVIDIVKYELAHESEDIYINRKFYLDKMSQLEDLIVDFILAKQQEKENKIILDENYFISSLAGILNEINIVKYGKPEFVDEDFSLDNIPKKDDKIVKMDIKR